MTDLVIFSGLPVLLPLSYFGSAAAVYAEKKTLAWILLLPMLLAVLWVAGAALPYQIW